MWLICLSFPRLATPELAVAIRQAVVRRRWAYYNVNHGTTGDYSLSADSDYNTPRALLYHSFTALKRLTAHSTHTHYRHYYCYHNRQSSRDSRICYELHVLTDEFVLLAGRLIWGLGVCMDVLIDDLGCVYRRPQLKDGRGESGCVPVSLCRIAVLVHWR